MHSAIVTVNVGSGSDAVLGFVVSKSSTAPEYGTIKDKPIFYTRKFTSGQSRNLYLSVTDKTPTTVTGFTTAGTPAKLTDPAQYLAEGTKYYLYTYDSSGAVLNTYSFTTQEYPTAAVVNAATLTANAGALYGYEELPSPTPVVDIKDGEYKMVSLSGINTNGFTLLASDTKNILLNCSEKGFCISHTPGVYDTFLQHNTQIGTRKFQDIIVFLAMHFDQGHLYFEGLAPPQDITRFKKVTH